MIIRSINVMIGDTCIKLNICKTPIKTTNKLIMINRISITSSCFIFSSSSLLVILLLEHNLSFIKDVTIIISNANNTTLSKGNLKN